MRTISVSQKQPNPRIYWPPSLKEAGYVGEVEIWEGTVCLAIPKPGASPRLIAKDLRALAQHFEIQEEAGSGGEREGARGR